MERRYKLSEVEFNTRYLIDAIDRRLCKVGVQEFFDVPYYASGLVLEVTSRPRKGSFKISFEMDLDTYYSVKRYSGWVPNDYYCLHLDRVRAPVTYEVNSWAWKVWQRGYNYVRLLHD